MQPEGRSVHWAKPTNHLAVEKRHRTTREIIPLVFDCQYRSISLSSSLPRLVVSTNLARLRKSCDAHYRSFPNHISNMFFTTPRQSTSGTNTVSPRSPESVQEEHNNKRKRFSQDHDHEQTESSHHEDSFDFQRRRVARACDRCRLKKTKCSGGSLCSRCKQDRVVCVTTPSATKKGDILRNPGYTHLVETQRDQLARALYQLLRARGPTDSKDVKSLLAEMGITTDSIRLPQQPGLDNNGDSDDIDRNNTGDNDIVSPSASQFWDDMFNELSGSQIEAIESFRATTPQFQSLLNNPEAPSDPFSDADLGFDYDFTNLNQLDEPMSSSHGILNGLDPQPSRTDTRLVPVTGASSDLCQTAIDPRSLTKTDEAEKA